MAERFTDEQLKAIETTDRSVLVSAAAGSGKTSVLVERILRIILDGKADVDELLVVTFTRAAASEMKLRLASAMKKRMREFPEDAERLADQVSRLQQAYISTIDSFAMRIIREFFYKIDIEPDFGACDEVQGELMRREALQEMMEAGFEEEDPGFCSFLRLYSEERQEETFRNNLLKAYSGLRTVPDYFDWAYSRAELLNVTAETFEGSELQAIMLEDAEDTFGRAWEAAARLISIMQEAGLDEMFREKFSSETSPIKDVLDAVQSGRLDIEVLEKAAAIEFPRLSVLNKWKEAYDPVKDDIKAARDAYKDEINNWNARYMTPDFATRLSEMNEAYRYTVYYIGLLEEFERRYNEKKRARHVMDFPDMEHNAVGILRDPEAASVLRKRFRFIFVDEYQDTNRIQEALISSISRPDNVFKVGDVKQSIYKFRQAEPSIFEEVYREYSVPGREDAVAIDLSRNFRSNDATIRYINRVFSEIMPGYDERARLYTGISCPPEYDFIPEVHILTDPDESGQEAETDADEEIQSLSKEEAEADYIAGIVSDLIGKEFYDTKTGTVRKVLAKDIVILFRAVSTRGDIMARALRNKGIEPYVEESDDYFDTVEISIALSMLTCIDNMKRDIPLIAMLHSEAFGWEPEELAEVRIAHREYLASSVSAKRTMRPAYFEALRWYTSNGPDGRLKDKAEYASGKILEWRRLSKMMPLEDFVWHVLTDSGYYRMAGAMNGGARRQANLRALADRAGRYSREGIASLSSFITLIDVMKKKKISNGQSAAAGPGDDVIRISTIHKSKGLEYPFVITGGLGHRFKYDNNEKAFSFDSDIGVSLPYIDPARRYWRSTIVQRAINSKSRRDSYYEELRILYVAMTRARNKLILVGKCKDEETLTKYTASPGSFLKVMRNVIRTGLNTYHVSPLEVSGKAARTTVRKIPDPEAIMLTEGDKALEREIDRRFTYEYPYSDLLTSKAKYSVSELRRESLAQEADDPAEEPSAEVSRPDTEVVNLWIASENRKKAGAADIGIAYHRIMEFIDFALAAAPDGSVDDEYIKERTELLRERGAIDENVAGSIDTGRISGFFRTDIGQRAADAARRGTLRKEKAFTLRTEKDGHDVLVQGVIDCCFEEDGKMILIDYKSSFIKPGKDHAAEIDRIRREYRVQIELYRDAILKGTGKDVSEAYLYLFRTGEALSMPDR